MSTTTRTDDSGTWHSEDGGTSWALTEPSQAWLAARAAEPEPEPTASPLDVLGSLAPEELRKVVALGVLFTQPGAVAALEQAVSTADPMAGVEVVTDVVVTAAEA